jgi:hypothetical protein
MRFHASVALLATCLQRAGRKTVRLRAPATVALCGAADGTLDVDDLGGFATADALAIAARYDQRNGNDRSTAHVRRVIGRADTTFQRRMSRGASDDDED